MAHRGFKHLTLNRTPFYLNLIEGFNITESAEPVAVGHSFTNVWSRSRTLYEGGVVRKFSNNSIQGNV